ncbi:MAG: ABC transporter permease [Sphingobacteriia bacterium]|nr:ABC transporter permease [Sphingobacteriia bacterium]
MLINYLKSALRNTAKNKFHSLLNLLGLAIGLAAFIFIILWVQNEVSYDKYHEKAGRIYRIESDFTISGKHDQFAIVPIPMGPALKLEFPEVETFCRFSDLGNTLIKYGEKEFYEEDFYFADSTVFSVFTHKMLMGNPQTCLTEPFSIVISQNTSKKYFGNENSVGKMLEIGNQRNYKITGVFEDMPANSHLRFDALLSVSSIAALRGVDTFNSMEPGRFWNIGVYTFLLLNENSRMEQIQEKFSGFYDKYMKPVGDAINASFNLRSTPLTKTHFDGNYAADLPKGNITYIYILSAIGIFILLIASINYMNMATARSEKRAREVGIRKVAGAQRQQLIVQFISESLLMAFAAFIVALALVNILIGDFALLTGKQMDFGVLSNPLLFLFILAVTFLIGVLSGTYPAFYLSSVKPVTVIKGSGIEGGKKGSLLRKILVVFQFAIAIALIIGTLVVSDQLRFLQNKDLGFTKDNMIVLELQDSTFRSKVESFKAELMSNPGIESVSNSTGVPSRLGWIQVVRIEKDTSMIEDVMVINQVDYNFINTYGLKLTKGRNFDQTMGTDREESVIVNQAAVDAYGWGDDAIGKKIHWGWDIGYTGGRMLKVIGVVEDFHYQSLHNKVDPAMLFLGEEEKGMLSIRIKPEETSQTLAFIEDKWNQFDARRPFDYQMLTDILGEQYRAEFRLGKLLGIATFLTIFIALLGLLGLSSFIAEQKTREIGIRKVMGATFLQILGQLYREFFILIVIAFVLAIPFALWQLHSWLENNFVYHNGISAITVLLSGLLAILISIMALSFHTVRASLANPVDAIKYE